MPLFPDAATLPESKNPERLLWPFCASIFSPCEIFKKFMLPSGKIFLKNIAISPDFVYTGGMDHSSLRRKQVSSPPVTAASGSRRGKAKLPSPPFFCCFSILPVFVFSALALLRIFALPAPLSFRCLRWHCRRTGFLHFSGFFDRPDIPRFRLCHRHGSRLFPGAAIISAPASFRCRSYAGISLFRNR